MNINNMIEYSTIKLIPATITDYPIIQNMADLYIYDMTEYMFHNPGWAISEDGTYKSGIDFKQYWNDEHTFPFLIRYHHELLGFVIINKKETDQTIDFNMAQFFIARKFKRKGIGEYIANQCFKRFKGVWEVLVIPRNQGAYDFWKAVITRYTKSDFQEFTHDVSYLKNASENIFRFRVK